MEICSPAQRGSGSLSSSPPTTLASPSIATLRLAPPSPSLRPPSSSHLVSEALVSPRRRVGSSPVLRTEERTKSASQLRSAELHDPSDCRLQPSPRSKAHTEAILPSPRSPSDTSLFATSPSDGCPPSSERMEELRKLMVMILDDIAFWVDGLQADIDTVRTTQDVADKRYDCKSLMQVKSVLEVFPVGKATFHMKPLPDLSTTTSSSSEAQRLLNFLKSTNFVLWEVKTKVATIKKYVSMTDSWTRLLTIGQNLNQMRRYFPTEKTHEASPPSTPKSQSSSESEPTSSTNSPHSSSPRSSPRSPYSLAPSQPPRISSPRSSVGSPLSFSAPAPSSRPNNAGVNQSSPRIVYAASATLPSPRHMHHPSSPTTPSGIARLESGRAQVRRSAHFGNFPARKRLTSLHLFFTNPESASSGSDSDESPRMPELESSNSGDELDDQERMKQLYLQHDRTMHRLTKGAGISKIQADRFLELLREMQLEGDFSAVAGGAVTQTISPDFRVAQLRTGISRPYHEGPIMLFTKGWKKSWGSVDQHSLRIYSSSKCDKLVREVVILEIACIAAQDKLPKEGQQEYCDVSLTCGMQLSLSAGSNPELTKWILSIDGMKDRSVITTSQKLSLLRSRYLNGVKGGSIKSVDDEEWTYNGKTGELTIHNGMTINGQKMRVSYCWNGQTLVPSHGVRDSVVVNSKSSTPTEPHQTNGSLIRHNGFGSGVWDGVTLMWFCEAGPKTKLQDFSLMHPDYLYLWDEQEREFIDGKSSPNMHWKFSRHFLASKTNHGHWIIEGDVPEPVVMSLQLMRYIRLGAPPERSISS